MRKLFNGPEAFTPDGEFILGESDVPGFWVAAGFCAHGLAGAGGMGWQMAEWVVERRAEPRPVAHGHPPLRPPVRAASATRWPAATRCTRRTTTSSTRTTSGRPAGRCGSRRRTRGSHELGAAFGEKSSWERANWFEPNAAEGDESLRPRGWAGEHWSPAIHAEAVATRTAAGLFDQSSFAKIEVQGAGATALLQRLCANDIDRPSGTVVYTQMLNSRGGIECRLHRHPARPSTRFRIVTGTAFGNHDMAWVRKHLPARRQRSRRTTSPRHGPASACGARVPATSCSH